MSRFVLLCALAASAQAAVPALMPWPVRMEPASGGLVIDSHFGTQSTGTAEPRLNAAITRFTARLSKQMGIPFTPPAAATLKIDCAAAHDTGPTLGEDESYTLDITSQGATLKSATVDGALHGLETFAQLVAPGPGGFTVPAVHIEDRPRFPWRGFMLDCSRHWMPVPVVLRNLDAMAAVKLNVFHWHLSDDQGFRVESRKFPRLQEMGSDGNYYTQSEIREVIAYARDRGIRVIPEFDIPGHTGSWFPDYPQLASTSGPFTIGRTFGIYDPVMDPTKETTYKFLDAFIAEMAQLFPDRYFHIGGDEVNGKSWTENPQIQAFIKSHNLDGPKGLQAYFNQRISRIVTRNHKIMIGWDEVLHPDLPTTTVIQSWRGNAALADAAQKGHRAILSWGFYLDHLRPASYHYGIDPLAGPAAELKPEETARILGGEACMWNEYASSDTVDSRVWPRLAAIAERLWSPAEVRDVDNMYERLAVVSRNLEWTGVEHRANYEPMLARLTGGQPSPAVRVLADACEATGLGNGRGRGNHNTTFTPLNRMVDAARPESESVRALELAAKRVVNHSGTADDLALLRAAFTEWAGNDARFEPVVGDNPFLVELKPISGNLAALGQTGLRLLDAISGDGPVPAGWAAQQSAALTEMEKPQAELRLAAVRPVRILLEAAAKTN